MSEKFFPVVDDLGIDCHSHLVHAHPVWSWFVFWLFGCMLLLKTRLQWLPPVELNRQKVLCGDPMLVKHRLTWDVKVLDDACWPRSLWKLPTHSSPLGKGNTGGLGARGIQKVLSGPRAKG